MAGYMAATLSPLVGKHTAEVAGWVEHFIAHDILPRIYPQALENWPGTATVATIL